MVMIVIYLIITSRLFVNYLYLVHPLSKLTEKFCELEFYLFVSSDGELEFIKVYITNCKNFVDD